MNKNDILNGYRNLRNSGVSSADAKRWLERHGSSLQDVAAYAQYGPDNVERARAAGIKARTESEESRQPLLAQEYFWKDSAKGALSGAEQVLNGATFGTYGMANDSLGGGYSKRKEYLQEMADDAGLGGLNRAANTALEFAGGAGPSAKIMQAIGKTPKVARALSKSRVGRFVAGALRPAAMPIEYAGAAGAGALTGALDPESTIGKIGTGLVGGLLGGGAAHAINSGLIGIGRNFIGKSALRRELANARKGRAVSDVDFGRLSGDRLDELNGLRDVENVARINNGQVVIPADRIQHIASRRIDDYGMSPREVSTMLDNAIHGSKSQMSRGNYPTLQAMLAPNELGQDIAIVGRHRDGDRVFVKSGYQNRGVTPAKFVDADAGRLNPASNLVDDLSDASPANNAIVHNSPPNVKKNDITDIIQDRNGYSAIQKGIHSSDEFAQEAQNSARSAIDNTVERVRKDISDILNKSQYDKNGKLIAQQFKGVGEDYGNFLKEFGDVAVDKNKVKNLLKNHPDIQPYINAARIKGKYSRGKPENSFAVLSETNRRMKRDLLDRMVNSSSLLQDKSYASNALDKLLDLRFPGREYMDKAFRRFKLETDILEDIATVDVADGSNFARKLNTTGYRDRISDLIGQDVADEYVNYLRGSSNTYNRLKNINNRAESKLSQVGIQKPFWRESIETVGSALGTIADWTYNNALKKRRTNLARDLLSGKKNVSDIKNMLDYYRNIIPVINNSMPRTTNPLILYNLLKKD